MYATDMNALALVPRQWLEFRDGSFCPLWKSVKLHLIHKRTKRQVRLFVCLFVQRRPSYGWTKRDALYKFKGREVQDKNP